MVCTKDLAAVCQAVVCRDVKEVFKEDMGTSLHAILDKVCTQLCSIHDHSNETSFLLHPSSPLMHAEHAALTEPTHLVAFEGGGAGGSEMRSGEQSKAKTRH